MLSGGEEKGVSIGTSLWESPVSPCASTNANPMLTFLYRPIPLLKDPGLDDKFMVTKKCRLYSPTQSGSMYGRIPVFRQFVVKAQQRDRAARHLQRRDITAHQRPA